MAEGNITRIVGGKHSIETEEWIVFTDKFTASAGGGSYFTADQGTKLGSPDDQPPAGKYFVRGWWTNSDNETIKNSFVGEKIRFHIQTKGIPVNKSFTFKILDFDGALTNDELDINAFYPGQAVLIREENETIFIEWTLGSGTQSLIESEGDEIEFFVRCEYDGDTTDLPDTINDYLDVEVYCCTAKCREPWQDLVDFDPRKVASVAKYIKNEYDHTSDFRSPIRRWAILPISSAYGKKLNMDYYSVKITKLPTTQQSVFKPRSIKLSEKPNYPRKVVLFEKGEKELWTSARLFDHVRKNLGFFLDESISSFYADSNRDQKVWDSEDPITTVMVFHINLPVIFDDAAVICSSFTPNKQWIFSPVKNPDNAEHPVSGNRQFGIRQIGTNYEFYIRGADRITGFLDDLGENAVFNGADALWKSFQINLVNFINQNGGEAEIAESKYVWKRCKWIAK